MQRLSLSLPDPVRPRHIGGYLRTECGLTESLSVIHLGPGVPLDCQIGPAGSRASQSGGHMLVIGVMCEHGAGV